VEKGPRNGGLFTIVSVSCELQECMVADAVAVEPVSAPRFPANREKNREFRQFEPEYTIEMHS
jgi:hypothetical protein